VIGPIATAVLVHRRHRWPWSRPQLINH
jgi:hypothetical protein